MAEETQPQPQTQAEQYSMAPLFETQKYSYQSKPLPGKPPVLNIGETLGAPVESGVNFQFGTIIT